MTTTKLPMSKRGTKTARKSARQSNGWDISSRWRERLEWKRDEMMVGSLTWSWSSYYDT